MMSLINLARTILPEGRFKDDLKEIYHFLKFAKMQSHSNGCTLNYSFKDKISRFEFNHGPLEGIRIAFPGCSYRWLSSIPKELPGYFSLGRIADDSIVIDAGAFPGDFTVAAARMVPDGKVFALEPDPNNRAYLEQVVDMNGLRDRVEVLPYALSNSNDTANMILLGMSSQIYSDESIIRAHPSKKTAKVETKSLDSLLAEEGILGTNKKIFVKMDIEGHEIKACAGARNTMKHGAIFAIAAYHPVDGQKTAVPLAEMFEDRGYEARQEYPPHLTLFAQPKMR